MPIFNLALFFESDAENETVPLELGGYTFLLRPLDGLESEEYAALNTQTGRAVYLLTRGVADGAEGKRIDEEGAKKLYARHPALALSLAEHVLDLTETLWREESARWECAKKNSRQTRMRGSGGPTAESTA